MRRLATAGVLLGLALAAGVRANNPEDLEFRATLVKQPAAFHAGELIEVELSYASSAERKYLGMWTTPNRFMGPVTVEITPREGVMDLRQVERGWAGSFAGTETDVSQRPQVEKLEVNHWYRFTRPGHFVLTVTSTAVSRRKTQEEGGGLEHLTLEAEVEFEILPGDPAWEATELAEIEQTLEQAPKDSRERAAGLHRLTLLDTSAAVKKMAEIYMAGAPGDATGNVGAALNSSGYADLIIALLKEGLSDPGKNPHALGADLLADLEVRKEKGIIAPQPADPEEQREWQKRMEERTAAYNAYFGQANELILASLKQRAGKERAEAAYEAWNNAERRSMWRSAEPGLQALREETLAVADDLEPGEQLNFVSQTWGMVAHEQVRPILERLIGSGSTEQFSLPEQAYEILCREWQRDCAKAIIADATQPTTKISPHAMLLLPEAEHPELDALLKEGLSDGKPPSDRFSRQRISALVLWAGSRNLTKAVREFLDQPDANRKSDCDTEAGLIGYLFRFAPEEAAKRTLAETMAEQSLCGDGILQRLDSERHCDQLVPIAIQTLDSADLMAAERAALLVGKYGAADAKGKLVQRLESLREEWRGRANEVRSVEDMTGSIGPARAAGYLEKALVSALASATNWKLTDEEKVWLGAGCLTAQCQAIAEGKTSMNF